MSATLVAAGRTLGASHVSVRVPEGWAVEPAIVRLPSVKRGGSRTAGLMVRVPDGTADGAYDLIVVAAPDEWSVEVKRTITVERRNLARGKPVTQSSTAHGGVPARAVDGNTNGTYGAGSVTHTDFQSGSWWEVDLGAVENIDKIAIWNRTDCCADRLTDFYVLVSDKPFASTSLTETLADETVWPYHHAGQGGTPSPVDVGRTGRYVRVQLAGNNALSLAEVQVFSPS